MSPPPLLIRTPPPAQAPPAAVALPQIADFAYCRRSVGYKYSEDPEGRCSAGAGAAPSRASRPTIPPTLWTSQRPAKRAMRRFYAVYASAEMMKVLPEPGRNDPMRAKSVVRSAQARGGCPAHADRVRPAACSSCMSLRSAWSLRIQIRPSSASGSAICNGARWRGCVSYFTLAAFSGRAAAPRSREGLGVDPDQVVNALSDCL